ncbi:MAG: 2-phospho-L-lactate transferase [Alphaproteobacteria bacterium]
MAGRVVVLCGGVGGAKLVLGLSKVLPPEKLLVVVNTGDDFEHFGLRICPDLDTVTYTLADLADKERGWGRAGETWHFMESLRQLGGADWFNLGDRDLALHAERTRRLKAGESLSEVTAALLDKLGVSVPVVPMSDDAVRTIVETDEGALPFQHYFVRRRCEPKVAGFRFDGAAKARPHAAFKAALTDAEAIVIAPSNPYVSVDPILALPNMRQAIRTAPAPVVAVSPIVGGKALKGPAAKMMAELGVPATAEAVAEHYRGLADAMVIDWQDRGAHDAIAQLGMRALTVNTVMNSLDDRIALARDVLDIAGTIDARAPA